MSRRTRSNPLPQVSRRRVRSRIPIARIPQPRENRMATTWQLAKPARIAAALQTAQSRNSGGWFVAGASGDVGRKESTTRTIAGREVVFWRNSVGALIAGPGACPHLGALLDKCPVVDGTMYCRWHGFALTQDGDQTWSPYRAYDDGVLIWVGLPTDGEAATDRPTLPARPRLLESVSAVVAKLGICEPQDVIANRLDPWHGSWFHPYAFSHLVVDDDASDDRVLVVNVTFRLSRTWGVPVRAEFTCPDTRTIVMHITEGEGAGSVVETHATPLGLGADGRPRTMVTEATIAYSD
jgi:phenylpropionate dioxygenase-like ring-hydroxylating dioxygenase large terminal subunit